SSRSTGEETCRAHRHYRESNYRAGCGGTARPSAAGGARGSASRGRARGLELPPRIQPAGPVWPGQGWEEKPRKKQRQRDER
ncbi:hypothetical protein P7K49_024292, partial [Saguinus oedipus]